MRLALGVLVIYRRFGANVDKAAKILHWRAERDLAAMCRDAWNWQVRNPEGSDNHCKKDTFIFVELKGSKINHAFVQLENTIKSLVLDNRFPNKVKVYARIVSSGIPLKSKSPTRQESLLNLLAIINGEKMGANILIKVLLSCTMTLGRWQDEL